MNHAVKTGWRAGIQRVGSNGADSCGIDYQSRASTTCCRAKPIRMRTDVRDPSIPDSDGDLQRLAGRSHVSDHAGVIHDPGLAPPDDKLAHEPVCASGLIASDGKIAPLPVGKYALPKPFQPASPGLVFWNSCPLVLE